MALAVRIRWSYPGTDVQEWHLEREGGGSDWILLGKFPGEQREHVDTNVSPGQTYSYRIRGANYGLMGSLSNVAEIAVGSPPAGPAELTVELIEV